MPGKREDYLTWNEFFIGMSLLASNRSKDPKTQVGAAIIKDKHVLSVGYNGTPKGMSDDEMPWDSIGEETNDLLKIKNSFVIHAEANALNNLPIGTDLTGASMYVTLSPCPECAKRIAQTGIKTVYYLRDYKKTDQFLLTKAIFKYANINLTKLEVPDLQRKLYELADSLNDLKKANYSKIRKK